MTSGAHGYRRCSWLAAALLVAGPVAPAASTDPETGLAVAPGWELVRTHCTACHSTRLITQQRGDAAQWLALIRWMQRTQNLWPIPAAEEAAIVTYLASSYPPAPRYRRRPLAAALLPPDGE